VADDVMARVIAAVQRGQAGERMNARQELEAVWVEVERGGGDDFALRDIPSPYARCSPGLSVHVRVVTVHNGDDDRT
jgi:hypothetical protein